MITDKHIESRIFQIAINLTRITSYSELLKNILNDSLDITNSDAGTLCILSQDKLECMIMMNRSKGVCLESAGNSVNLPSIDINSKSVCAFVARERKTMNVPDVRNDTSFEWDTTLKFDEINSYYTMSELVIPLIDHEQNLLGVLQLINARDEKGQFISYTEYEQYIMEAVASLAAVSLSNYKMINQLQDLLDSFVLSFTTAIDARTPYNANHTRHVAQYCKMFCEFLREKFADTASPFNLSVNQIEQIVMAANLHDVGKMIVPLEVMNKPDRLGGRLKTMELRWKWLLTDLRLKRSMNLISEDEFLTESASYIERMKFVRFCNSVSEIDDETFSRICSLSNCKYISSENEICDFVSDEELTELKIRKGTLTEDERRIIEKHAEYTTQILDKIAFGDKYCNVRFFAGAHHELLNGSGYPARLSGDDIPIEVRIITIMDVLDSLTSSDRPYKKEIDLDHSISILYSMVEEGKLDKNLVELVEEFFRSEAVMKEIVL